MLHLVDDNMQMFIHKLSNLSLVAHKLSSSEVFSLLFIWHIDITLHWEMVQNILDQL